MKKIPAALQEHLDTKVTTMCFCWKITRRDGVVQGFTDHDLNLQFVNNIGVSFDGNPLLFNGEQLTFTEDDDETVFLASTGFTATAVQSSLGLNVDNLNVEGALSSDTINEKDLSAGRYDAAEIELWWVNWQDTRQRILLSRGNLGEVERKGVAFNAELRSLTQKAQQKTGRTFQRYCDAKLGDSRCKVNLNSLAVSGAISEVTDNKAFSTSSNIGANDRFTLGLIRFTTGQNAGIDFEIRTHVRFGVNMHSIEFWSSLPYPMEAGDQFTVFPGCKKDRQTCASKFNNLINFQGFEFIPGNDMVSAYPEEGRPGQDGRSLFGN